MAVTHDSLKNLGFHLTHECQLTEKKFAQFTVAKGGHQPTLQSCKPMVYVWLSAKNGDEFDVFYVGKAGLGVSQRLKQHENGFRHSIVGTKNLKNICEHLNANRNLVVYARISGVTTLFGIKDVNQYSVDEEAIQELFQPQWNRAEFATARQKSLSIDQRKSNLLELEIPSDERCLVVGQIDFTGMLGSEMLRGFIHGLSPQNKLRLNKLLIWVKGLKDLIGSDIKLVKGYVGQPKGYNKVATLVFSPVTKSGRANREAWLVRIPLRCDQLFPLGVTLPDRKRSEKIAINSITEGKGNCFSPNDLDSFLENPDYFTTLR